MRVRSSRMWALVNFGYYIIVVRDMRRECVAEALGLVGFVREKDGTIKKLNWRQVRNRYGLRVERVKVGDDVKGGC